MKNYILEFPDGADGLRRAVEDAADGEVVYLRGSNRIVAAVVPIEVAAAGVAALDAADQVADLALGEALLAELQDGAAPKLLAELQRELT
ncbi:MAG TPA: hypothetical protein VFB74_20970 [Kribbellaceae bacterium]|nr:hypothetical protein [Kribbellaceae bacterium]